MKLSFIIPIYNTEYSVLKKCIESICSFKNSNYEVILIDDGSREELSIKYKKIQKDNIKYYKKENAGVSAARNFGLLKARGEYVIFVDSDDIVYTDKINYDLLTKDYDLIYFDYFCINKTGIHTLRKEVNSNEECELDSVVILKELLGFDKHCAVWNKIFKKEFLELNVIKFDVDMINGEDIMFNLNTLLANPKMYYCNKAIYGYYISGDNYEKRVQNKFDNILHDYLYKYKIMLSVIKKNDFGHDIMLKLQNDTVEQIFRISMICSKYKMSKKKEICSYINEFDINKADLSLANKIKYNSLNKQKWGLVHLLSKMRNIYLKIKRS